MITPEDQRYLEQQEQEMRNMQTNVQTSQVTQAQQAMMMQEQEKNMIKDQLDLSHELETIENLLRGNVLRRDADGNVKWSKPEDPEMKILSEYGIHLIMNTITFYINKNTLLSNYDEDTIAKKMEDFATDLADTIFMEYEKVFEYPTMQECHEKLIERLEKKRQQRILTNNLQGFDVNPDVIWKQLVDEIDPTKEEEKIKQQIIKNKLKRFLILIREVQDSVHSTYLRAYQGQERRTLRQHIHVTESIGGNQQPQQGSNNPLKWFTGQRR